MYIGVDPGKVTGVWFLPHDAVEPWGGQFLAMDAVWEIERALKQVKSVMEMLNTPQHDIVIALERYDIGFNTIKKSRQTDALEVIGAIKYLAHVYDDYITVKVVMQARNIKARVTDAVLKRLGWWEDSQTVHMHDAQRHVIAAIAGDKQYEELVKQAYDIV